MLGYYRGGGRGVVTYDRKERRKLLKNFKIVGGMASGVGPRDEQKTFKGGPEVIKDHRNGEQR